jgi:hypothetical protein
MSADDAFKAGIHCGDSGKTPEQAWKEAQESEHYDIFMEGYWTGVDN